MFCIPSYCKGSVFAPVVHFTESEGGSGMSGVPAVHFNMLPNRTLLPSNAYYSTLGLHGGMKELQPMAFFGYLAPNIQGLPFALESQHKVFHIGRPPLLYHILKHRWWHRWRWRKHAGRWIMQCRPYLGTSCFHDFGIWTGGEVGWQSSLLLHV